MDTILYDSAMRLFGDLVTPSLLEEAESGTWPAGLWSAVAEAGYLDVLAEGPGGMVEAATILRAAGHHAAPIPLPETMLARWIACAAGLGVPDGPLGLAPVEPDDRLTLAGHTVSGRANHVPWGAQAHAFVVIAGATAMIVEPGARSLQPDRNMAGEPRDHLELVNASGARAALPDGIDQRQVLGLGALSRAAQMAGALEAILGMSTQYANDRVQFGRPIGKFQAVQQQMALLAEQAAAATVAVAYAARSVAEGRASAAIGVPSAKIRAGEAAGKATDIAHQVHGAIGFTYEHGLHRLTRRLWSWRDEFGNEAFWSRALGRAAMREGAEAMWPSLTAS